MTHAERLIYLVLEPGFKNENQRGRGGGGWGGGERENIVT